MNNSF